MRNLTRAASSRTPTRSSEEKPQCFFQHLIAGIPTHSLDTLHSARAQGAVNNEMLIRHTHTLYTLLDHTARPAQNWNGESTSGFKVRVRRVKAWSMERSVAINLYAGCSAPTAMSGISQATIYVGLCSVHVV